VSFTSSLLDDVDDDRATYSSHAREPMRSWFEAAKIFERRSFRRSDWAKVFAT
jgi:hypothetical protein